MKQLYLCLVAALLSFSSFAAPAPPPSAITGTLAICDGGTGSLSSSPSGGTWASDNVAVAPIDMATGVFVGVAAGTANVTYTDGSGFVTAVVTVNPTPSSIFGTPVVCAGSSTTLSSSPAGGTWSSGNISVAFVGATGIVTGGAAGTAMISYTLGTGCATFTEVTVNPLPSIITGVTTVCVGGVSALSNSAVGGVWTSSNPAVADVDYVTGVVTGHAVGSTAVTYMLPTGCISTTTVTVASSVAPILGNTPVCPGGTVTLTDATAGGTWSSSDATVGVVGASGVFTGNATGTAYISYTLPGGCSSIVVATVFPTPAIFAVTGGGEYCAGGSGVSIGLSSSSVGISYQLFSPSPVGSPIMGTGTALSFGAVTVPGTYSVMAVSPLTTCMSTMSGTATVSTAATPGVISGTLSVCVGNTTTLSNTMLGGSWSTVASTVAVGPSDGAVVGLTAGTATITYSAGTCGDVYTVVTVNALPAAITGVAAICSGSTTATLSNTTPGGTWSSEHAIVATIGSSSGIVSGGAPGTTTISYTLPTGCATTTVATVNTTAGISGAAVSVCAGGTATLSAIGGVGAWSSSAPTIATVTSSGIVSGVSAGTVTITLTNACGIVTRNLLIGGSSTFDLSLTQTMTYRPGFASGVIYVTNTECGSVSPVVTMHVSPKYVLSWSYPAPASIVGNTITWNLPAVSGAATSTEHISVYMVPSSSVSLGDTVHADVQVAPMSGDMNPANNYLASIHTVTGSYDPNEVAVSPQGYILPCQELTYRVQFENDGNDTAFNIYVLDTLSANLDPASIIAVSATHTMNMTVYNSGGYNVARFDFPNINLLDSSHHGEATGEFVFKIKALTALSDGATINNRVGIYFDSNPVVMTNQVTNTIGIAPIVGPGAVCRGASITMTDATVGGAWASVNGRTSVTGGVVTGIAGGLDTVMYTTSNACASRTASATVSVNTIPAVGPITGAAGMCVGATTTMGNATPGGVWTSSNIFTGPVGPFNGVVYGASASVVMISYRVANGCGDSTVTAPVIIDPMPSAGSITGPGMVCQGASATLVNSVSGGAWTSSNTALAVVGSTGNVSGIAGGTVTIFYSVSNACATAAATAPIYVNPLPNAGTIVGASALCIGFTTPMTNSVSGGTWSSVGSAISISSTGVVTGLSVGSANVYYTVTNVCGSDATLMPLIVEALPGAGAIVVPGDMCPGHSMLLTDSVVGGAWSGGSAAIATISGAGVVMAVASGTTTVSYSLGNSCGTALATAVVSVSAVPTTASITGTTMVCSGETTTLSNATGGGVWTGGTPGVASVSGTGVVTGLASGTTAVSYSVSNTCGTARATTIVTVNTTYTPMVFITAAPGAVISAGQTVTLTAGVSGAGPAPDYQWMKNGVPVAGQTLSAYITNTLAEGDSITCRVTGSGPCGKVSYNSVIMHVVSATANVDIATSLSIHPNPTRGMLLINGTIGSNDETAVIVVTNMLGQTVYTGEAQLRNGSINTQVQLRDDLANGNYILNIHSANGNSQAHFVLER